MSRLGKLPIEIPEGTQAKIEDNFIVVKGPRGKLVQELHNLITVKVNDKKINISIADNKSKKEKALWGLYRSLINNMVVGVNEGFEKKLEINGVGFRASTQGRKLVLNVGYSHPVEFDLPQGIEAAVDGNVITISGIDKQLVGEIAAQVRKTRKPEPYKGKGIKYADEIIKRKAGKAAVKGE